MSKETKVSAGKLRILAGHKKLVAVVLVLALAAGGWFVWKSRARAMPTVTKTSYVRTVTLSKGSLEDSISATGTVQSDELSSVTTSLKYTVKEVNVQVGDTVQAGDVICTLDTESLEKSIAKAKETLAENQEKALKNYQKAQDSVTEAQAQYSEALETLNQAQTTLDSAQTAYDQAAAKISTFQSKADAADATQQEKLAAWNQAVQTVDERQNEYNAAYAEWDANQQQEDLLTKRDEAYTRLQQAQTDAENAQKAYEQAKQEYQQQAMSLTEAQNSVGFNGLEQALQQAKTAKEQAETACEQALKTAENAEDTRAEALETYNKSGESDELEDLQEQLEECTLKAETSGKVTALNATVGSSIEGVAATIQNPDKLKISISIAEYDIESVQVGMSARITSDVMDGEVAGTLTQISPTATGGGSSSSTFAAEVTVDDANSGLLIGTNAKVEIMVSTTEDVFTVPLDAVEEQEDGTYVIYVQQGQSDGEQVFEPVTVTLGQQNDYYTEISGVELSEGLVVRASANQEEATETTDSPMMGGGMMGGMEFGATMPGDMASGGMGGNRGGNAQGGGQGGAPGMGG